MRATAKKYPRNSLIFYPPGKVESDGTRLNYLDLAQSSEVNAKSIHQLGLKPDSIVLLHFDNRLDNPEWFWVVVFTGYIPALSTPFVKNIEQGLNISTIFYLR